MPSTNYLPLILNSMQESYTQTSITSSKNPAMAADAFTRFMKEFQSVLGTKEAPLIALYNTPNIRQARSLDQFIREILINTIQPSQTLLLKIKAIRDGLQTDRNPL